MTDAHDLLRQVLESHSDTDKWVGEPFEKIKRVSNSKVGEVGEDFVAKLCDKFGLSYEFPTNQKGRRSRQNPWDMRIEDAELEVKTASEDVNGSFQFNHFRYQREYRGAVCIGISPGDIFVGAWTKAELTTGRAGHLVSMERGGSASYKLTKKPDSLRPIAEFERAIRDLLERLRQEAEIH